jgi:hypothetical protein
MPMLMAAKALFLKEHGAGLQPCHKARVKV